MTPAFAQLGPTSLSPATPAIAPTISSPVTGISFADAPRLLPVDTRFSQAIQTVGFDVGLTCQQIEAYGWKVAPNEQNRVNNIFANTAEELARLGYSVQPQNPGSAAADITVFTATRGSGPTAQNVLFTWSAGKAGLLLLLCDARGDVTKQGFGPAPGSVNYSSGSGSLGTMTNDSSSMPALVGQPTDIIGEWPGTYSCLGQGPAGGTLTISRVRADKSGYAVSGIFSFYPLADKNLSMVRGSYRLAGRYDPLTHRALLEPGNWIDRPAGFTYAPLIAEFDIAGLSKGTARVSAMFQGTTGCTSFEGNFKPDSAGSAAAQAPDDGLVAKKKKKPAAAKKPVAKVVPATIEELPVAKTTETVTTTKTAPVVAETPAPDTPVTEPVAPAVVQSETTTTTTTTVAPVAPVEPATGTAAPKPAATTTTTKVEEKPATRTESFMPPSKDEPVTIPAAPTAAQ